MQPKYIHHGDSLPMLDVGGKVFRVQILIDGKWETLESEEAYDDLFNDLIESE